jgi:hypothetical protein
MLRTERTALIVRGVANPNLTRTSDYWVRAESLSQQISVLYANQQILAEQSMPDTAEDDDLGRWLAMFAIGFRPAQPAAGNVVLSTSAATFITTDQQLLDAEGQVYQVTVGGTYNDGDLIPIIGISTGLATDHPQGTVLQWIGTPAFADIKALVAIGGLIDGADTDTNETARNRLLTFFRNPPQGGNWSQVKGWAEASSASVQAAYVYPAINGPATLGICVVGPLEFDLTLGWTREVSTAVLNTAATYVAARMPTHVDIVTATPIDVPVSSPDVDTDVSIGLTLPISSAGGGPGGGWVDATPWPALLGTSTRVTVSAVTSSTDITLTSDDAATTPSTTGLIAGETTIAWFSSANFAAGQDPLVIATVVSIVSGVTGAIRITLSTPFTGVVVGDFVMPNAENIQDYARAWLGAMNDMGPGEWSAHAQVLVRGRRYPLNDTSNPYSLGGVQLRAITDVGSEVRDVAYLYRNVTTPAAGVAVTPGNPASAPPNILVPRRVAFFNKIP